MFCPDNFKLLGALAFGIFFCLIPLMGYLSQRTYLPRYARDYTPNFKEEVIKKYRHMESKEWRKMRYADKMYYSAIMYDRSYPLWALYHASMPMGLCISVGYALYAIMKYYQVHLPLTNHPGYIIVAVACCICLSLKWLVERSIVPRATYIAIAVGAPLLLMLALPCVDPHALIFMPVGLVASITLYDISKYWRQLYLKKNGQ